MAEKGYRTEESELGKVYYPCKGIWREETVTVKRMEYPWITRMEVEGMKVNKAELAEVL